MQTGIALTYFLLGWTLIVPFVTTLFIYRYLFAKRCDKTEMLLTVQDYPDLESRPFSVKSGKTQLACFEYRDKSSCDKNALVLVSHGIGCTHGNYLNRIAYFAHKGYVVIGFDITGCGDSGGKSIKGMPQSHIDIHNVLTYIENAEQYKGMPVFVYGHSWSGYGVAAALNYGHKPAAVVTASGFDKQEDIMRFQAVKMCGRIGAVCLPWIRIIEKLRFGKVARYTASGGINSYGGPVLIMHSKDDPTVPYSCSVAACGNITNPNVSRVVFEDRGHTLSRSVAAEKIIENDFAGKPRRKMYSRESYFKYEVDIHYHFSDKKVVFDTDEKFMDIAGGFFEKVLSDTETI